MHQMRDGIHATVLYGTRTNAICARKHIFAGVMATLAKKPRLSGVLSMATK